MTVASENSVVSDRPLAAAPSTQGRSGGLDAGAVVAALRRRWLWLLLVPTVTAALAYGASHFITPTYTARTAFLPPQQQQSIAASALASIGSFAGLTGAAVRSPADQYVALMQSETLTNRLIERFHLLEVYGVPYKIDARREIAEKVRFSVGKKDGVIGVEVDDASPQRAAEIANRYVEELRLMSESLAVTEAQQRRAFFEKQLRSVQEKLAKAQTDLQSSGFTSGALQTEPRAAAESYARLRAELAAAQVRLQVLRSQRVDDTPEVQQQLAVVAGLRDQLARVERPAAQPPAATADYVGKLREFKYQETLFDLLAKQYELARVDESREGPLIQVIDVAQPPERRSAPRRGRIAIVAWLLALAATAALVLARHDSALLRVPARQHPSPA